MADSVFVEDAVVIVGNTAMITNPGAVSRRAETTRVKKVLETFHSSDLRRIQQTEGTLDGGDVLFTGEGFDLPGLNISRFSITSVVNLSFNHISDLVI